MSEKKNLKDLFLSVTEGMTGEEVMLSGILGIIAGEIAIKRQELGMTQEDLAERLGVSQGLVSRWESAETNFTMGTLIRIASALDLKVQSPLVPKAPLTYTVGTSNIIAFPESHGAWPSNSYQPSPNYNYAKEN